MKRRVAIHFFEGHEVVLVNQAMGFVDNGDGAAGELQIGV
jgi:hypothetical protein